MDYKYLMILAAVYSVGVLTSRVLALVRAVAQGVARALDGVKAFDLRIKYERDNEKKRSPLPPLRE